ncbi:MAG: DNA-directed RNA polymerase subunit H [Candidatus Aenigmatarchaeota archaeon]
MAKDYSVTDHKRVPEHEVLGDEEKEELLEELGVKEQQLPKIYDTDPVVKEIDASVGDVLKIKRNSLTAGKALYYRLVIEKK